MINWIHGLLNSSGKPIVAGLVNGIPHFQIERRGEFLAAIDISGTEPILFGLHSELQFAKKDCETSLNQGA